jgi:hypothetical protein
MRVERMAWQDVLVEAANLLYFRPIPRLFTARGRNGARAMFDEGRAA